MTRYYEYEENWERRYKSEWRKNQDLKREVEELTEENDKLRNRLESGGVHTLMMCKDCEKGVRPKYAVKGRCYICAADYIDELNAKIEELETDHL